MVRSGMVCDCVLSFARTTSQDPQRCDISEIMHDSLLTHIQATCSRFYQSCQSKGILLDQRGFKLSYETTIPRQLGLSGSSALVCATFNCLLHWFDLHQDWPVPQRPQFVLDVETAELGITGGLMDRVAQVSTHLSIPPAAPLMIKTASSCFLFLSSQLR